jgi:hypothetical protein
LRACWLVPADSKFRHGRLLTRLRAYWLLPAGNKVWHRRYLWNKHWLSIFPRFWNQGGKGWHPCLSAHLHRYVVVAANVEVLGPWMSRRHRIASRRRGRWWRLLLIDDGIYQARRYPWPRFE